MKLDSLKTSNAIVGVKSLMRRLNADGVAEVFLADDADLFLKKKVRALCQEKNVPINDVSSMAELGRAAGVDVPTAAAGILN